MKIQAGEKVLQNPFFFSFFLMTLDINERSETGC